MRTGEKDSEPKANSWVLATLALRVNRIDLIQKFNLATGAPSYNVAKMQHEFIKGEMEPAETIAFAKVCLDLIDAAVRARK